MFPGLVDFLRRDFRLGDFPLYLRGGPFRRLQVLHQRRIAQYVIYERTTTTRGSLHEHSANDLDGKTKLDDVRKYSVIVRRYRICR